jgi:hypothetical protein
MPLRYLFDENLCGPAWDAVERHNARAINVIDVVRVADPQDLPLGSTDPDILLWAERSDRILVTLDVATMQNHLRGHLAAGHHYPGVFLVSLGAEISYLIEMLATAVHASDPEEWRDGSCFIA